MSAAQAATQFTSPDDSPREIVYMTGGPVSALSELARDLEGNGEAISVDFHRNGAGEIDGLVLLAAVAV